MIDPVKEVFELSRAFVRRSEGFLSGGKSASLAPVAQGLSWLDDAIGFGGRLPPGPRQFLHAGDAETLSGGLDHAAAGLPANSGDPAGSEGAAGT